MLQLLRPSFPIDAAEATIAISVVTTTDAANYVMSTIIGAVTSSWLLDSGATQHNTSDGSTLIIALPVIFRSTS